MTYTAGTSGLAGIGVPDGPPRITCNGCGLVFRIERRGAGEEGAPAWFVNGKAPPGWKLTRDEADRRIDHCPRCKDGNAPT